MYICRNRNSRARQQLYFHIPLSCVSLDSVISRLDLTIVQQRVALHCFVPLSSKVGRWLGPRALSGHISLFKHSSQPQVLKRDNAQSSSWRPLRHSVRMLTLVIPPSTTKSVPFTKLLSSLARKRAACACSMASPKRPDGKWISRRWRLAASSPSQS